MLLKIKAKGESKLEENADLSQEFDLLKKEFRVPEDKLRLPTDEEIMELIKARLEKLKTTRVYAYLAGPIELVGDFGETWRNWLTPHLLERGIFPLDPAKLERHKVEMVPGGVLKKLDELRRKRDWAGFRTLAGKIRYVDTNLIRHKAACIIMYVPERELSIDRELLNPILTKALEELLEETKDRRRQEFAIKLISNVIPEILPKIFKAMARGEATGGTSSENQIAVVEKIPVFLVCSPRALDTFSSSWVLDAVLERGRVFEEFDKLLDFIDKHNIGSSISKIKTNDSQ